VFAAEKSIGRGSFHSAIVPFRTHFEKIKMVIITLSFWR
jgi:hypothetical protein